MWLWEKKPAMTPSDHALHRGYTQHRDARRSSTGQHMVHHHPPIPGNQHALSSADAPPLSYPLWLNFVFEYLRQLSSKYNPSTPSLFGFKNHEQNNQNGF